MPQERQQRTLSELRAEVKKMAAHVNRPSYPYAHNIIGLLLSQIADGYGQEEANRAIRDFGLTKKGWSKEPAMSAPKTMPDPILTQLIALRIAYSVHLARVSASPMDPLFKAKRVEELRGAVTELDTQIANLQGGA